MKLSDKEILFLDNHLLLVHKPAGLLTQSSGLDEDNLEDSAKAFIKEKFQKKGNVFLHAVHRLDREVEGIVIFARTSKSLERMQKEMREKKIKRVYLAKVSGHFSAKEGRLEHFLKHGSHKSELSKPCDKEAQKAILFYKVIEEGDGFSVLNIELETGRYHQIRAQMAYSGHPIFGDTKYGSRDRYEGIALKNVLLEFVHPVTKEKLVAKM